MRGDNVDRTCPECLCDHEPAPHEEAALHKQEQAERRTRLEAQQPLFQRLQEQDVEREAQVRRISTSL